MERRRKGTEEKRTDRTRGGGGELVSVCQSNSWPSQGCKLSSLGSLHSTLKSFHCTLYSIHCTLLSVHCTLYSVQFTVYSVKCTLYSVECTLQLYTVHSETYKALNMYFPSQCFQHAELHGCNLRPSIQPNSLFCTVQCSTMQCTVQCSAEP